MAQNIRIDPNFTNVLGSANQDSVISSEFNFHHGHVEQVINTADDLQNYGQPLYKLPSDVSQLILISPTFQGSASSDYLKNTIIGQPLLRGISDSISRGDSVIFTVIGNVVYYLGPLNTTNNPNYVPDNYYNPNLNPSKLNIDKRKDDEYGYNVNYKKRSINKVNKLKNYDLDRPYGTGIGEIGSDADLESSFSDLVIEGRHGNSIEIGTRFINPFINIKNNNTNDDRGSFIGMLSFGSISDYINGFNTLSSDLVVQEAIDLAQENEDDSYLGNFIGIGNDNTESDDIPRQDRFNINYGQVKETPDEQLEFDQMIVFSDRITFDARKNDLTFSAHRNLNIGSGQNISITSKGFSLIESENIYLGVQSQNKQEPIVLGNELRLLLIEIMEILQNSRALVQGVPIPFVKQDSSPVAPDILDVITRLNDMIPEGESVKDSPKERSDNFLSTHHFIEQNDRSQNEG